MEVIVKGAGDMTDPRTRVLAIEAAAKAICQSVQQDTADAVMMLLTAAVHLAMQHSGGKTVQQVLPGLAHVLGAATVSADEFFTLRKVAND